LNNKVFKYTLFDKTDHDRFVLKFCQKSELKSNILNRTKFETSILKRSSFSNKTGHVFLKLLDTHGEILLKKPNFYDCRSFKNKKSKCK